jgi:hypothetical protein
LNKNSLIQFIKKDNKSTIIRTNSRDEFVDTMKKNISDQTWMVQRDKISLKFFKEENQKLKEQL